MRRLPVAFTLCLGLWSQLVAAAMCVDPERPELSQPARGGIGGTGSPMRGGIGGTGSPAKGGGIGGTGSPAKGGGIGGTGSPAKGGGIGGTGTIAAGGIGGTGIVGVVTGFASVCVGGVEVHVDENATVTENGAAANPDQIAVGQVVSIEAGPGEKGLTARSIALIHALEGPITKVHGGGKSIEVLGHPVHIDPDTRIGSGKGLAVGQMVKVSGLLGSNGQMIVTRIQDAPNLKHASVVGSVSSNGKQATVNGVPVKGRIGNGNALVQGEWNGSELVARSIQPDPTFRFVGKVEHLLIEGMVQKPLHNGHMHVGGMEITVGRDTQVVGHGNLEGNAGQRVFIEGRLAPNGVLHADHVEVGGRTDLPGTRSPVQNKNAPAGDGSIGKQSEPAGRDHSSGNTGSVQESDRKAEEIEKLERFERAAAIERPEKIEKVEKIEKIEKIEKVERVERPEKTERSEKAERPERAEKPERRERH